jgi:hypothetical protein
MGRVKDRARAIFNGGWVARVAPGIPWLWVDLVVSRLPVPPCLLSVGLFFALFAIGSLIAAVAGEPLRFLLDIRRLAIFALPAFASFTIADARQALTKLQISMKPWVATPEDESVAFWDSAPRLLMSGFWLFAVLWAAIPVLYGIIQHAIEPTSGGHVHHGTMRQVAFVMAPLIGYFMGGATSIAIVGLARIVHRLDTALDLKEGFVLRGAKAILQPFNRLFWVTWSTVALPLLLVGMVAVTLGYTSGRAIPLGPTDVVALTLVGMVLVLTIIVPQLFMNRFLRKEKGEALEDITEQIAQAVTIPEGASGEEVLRRMHRLQSLVYLEGKIERFKPTLVDARFLVEFAAVLTTIVSAFIAIRTFLHALVP